MVTFDIDTYVARSRALDLSGNAIKEKGVRALADSPHLGRIGHLVLTRNGLGPRAVKWLRARFGDRVEV